MSIWHIQTDAVLQVPALLQHTVSFLVGHPLFLAYIYSTYTFLAYLVLLGLFVLPVYSLRIGREYILALSIATLLSLPLWLVLPTVGPAQLAISNIFPHASGYVEDPALTPVRSLYENFEGTTWSTYVLKMTHAWNSVTTEGGGYAISNNPSMHVIWGIILTLYVFRVHHFLGIGMLMVTVGEIMGTLVFLQHYAVDLVTGAGVAYLAIIFARYILRIEQTYMRVDVEKWFGFVFLIHATILFVRRYFNTLIRRVVNGK